MFTDQTTINFLRLCYQCDDAYLCETEEQCLACWNEQEGIPQDAELTAENETAQWLRMVYA